MGAATLFGAVEGLLERLGGVPDIEDRQPYERKLVTVQGLLSAAVFAEAWAAGRALPLHQVLDAALEQQDACYRGGCSAPPDPPI